MMQKKNLAALVAAMFALPVVAHADVTIYGFMSGGIESTKATGSGGSEYSSRTRIVDHNSRIGFKGFEDIGGGTKAIWQVENSLRNFEQGGTNDKGQTASFATRNTFIGIDNNDFGRVVLGQHDSAYKMFAGSGNSALGTDLMVNTTADNFGSSSVNSRGEARLPNSVHYFSQAGPASSWARPGARMKTACPAMTPSASPGPGLHLAGPEPGRRLGSSVRHGGYAQQQLLQHLQQQ